MNYRNKAALALMLTGLFITTTVSGQKEILVYDGHTGIASLVIQRDTPYVSILLEGGPAEKAGIRFRDQILAIGDLVVAGRGMDTDHVHDRLLGRAGDTLDLKIGRKGQDSLLHFHLILEPYLHQIEAFDYLYLVDSLEQWGIEDLLSGQMDSLFCDPVQSKITVHSVEAGSPAEENGLLPGDRVISLADEMDDAASNQIGSQLLDNFTIDTTLSILRGDSLISIPSVPSVAEFLEGVSSRFSHDLNTSCVWLKIRTRNEISQGRDYLVNIPEMVGTDSLNLFQLLAPGQIVERRSGVLIPVEERDFVYKNWHAVSVPLYMDSVQTFYLRHKSWTSVGAPLMHLMARDTLIRHDRLERIVLFAYLGMMLIIALLFLIIFLSLHEWQYLFFFLYILCFASFLFVSEGYLGEYQWKEGMVRSVFFSSARPLTISFVSIFFLLFGSAYLELRKRLVSWHRIILVLLALISVRPVALFLTWIFDFQIGTLLEDILLLSWVFFAVILPLFILVIPAISRIRQGSSSAWYFLVANIVLVPLTYNTAMSAGFTWTMHTLYDSVLSRIFQVSGVYFAAVLQILIFSIGLARKMKQDEKAHQLAQEKIIQQLKENQKLREKVNRELEEKVKERTQEIRMQKEEIESQRDEIEAQRDLLFDQKNRITDSIGYAQRIQAAILPRKSYLDRVLPEYFVMFRPRDIVSGDFYWVREMRHSLVVVAADCTGHGIPGAFMSMLGITLLNEELGEGRVDMPGIILGRLRSKVKALLVQEGDIGDQKDGMDMAMLVIDKEKRKLQFAGAYSPLYLVRRKDQSEDPVPGSDVRMEGELSNLYELKGDSQPIGIHWKEEEFKTHIIPLQEGDTLYLFSDGYVDQYGGNDRKKFKTGSFRKLLLSLQAESMARQKAVLEETFDSWRGQFEQIDDVCVVGVRI